MRWLYDIGVFFYSTAVSIFAIWNDKAHKRKKGATQSIPIWPKTAKKRYWFHCASLGEFEMARPLIERLKVNENCEILLSFFSPSGYEIRKNYDYADRVVYLPFDTHKNASKFLNRLQPDVAFFIKYEFWLHFISQCKKRNIKLYTLASIFRSDQRFFKLWGKIFYQALLKFNHFFVLDNTSQEVLAHHNISNATVVGDPKVDRVVENAKSVQSYEAIENFCQKDDIFICGSTWSEDEAILLPFISKNNIKTIIAPHEIGENHIKSIAQKISIPCQRFSTWRQSPKENTQVLIIDNIGMLANIYQYGTIAYIGGAFRTGLHNILEPAAFHLPVIFGPKHSKFPEAQAFIDRGIGISIQDFDSFKKAYNHFQETNVSEKIKAYLDENIGATDQVYQLLQQT